MSYLRTLVVLALLPLIVATSPAYAQASCSATNDSGDANCSITCQVGQAAECRNGTGGSAPTCECKGDPQPITQLIARPSVLGILSTSTLSIEKSNVLETINQKLAGLRDYKISEVCNRERVGRRCYREPCLTSIMSAVRSKQIEALPFCPRTCEDVYDNVCRQVQGK